MDKITRKRAIHRLKITEGQIRGLQKMVDKEEYCVDIITQTSAIKQALSSIEDLILENHLARNVIAQIKSGQETKAIKEILSVYKLSNRK